MVKVTFKFWDEVIIHESIQLSYEDMVKRHSLGVQPGGLAPPLRWAEGVAFVNDSMPPTDEIVREQLQGKIHWSVVQWALMPQYKNVIPITDISAKIPVINVSDNNILCEVAKALKATAKTS
jgi:hypothetical protein